MTQNRLLIMIIIISSCFFAVSLLFNQGKCVVTSLIRGVCGMVVIGMANTFLSGFGVFVPVGINFLNFAVSAFLGIPGILAIYGIGFWQMFH